MASMCVEISTTRAISQQIIRHSSFHFQEYSQRYAPVPKAEVPALRRIDSKNRQNSFDDLDDEIVTAFQNMIQEHFDKGLVVLFRPKEWEGNTMGAPHNC
jgi:thymidylate synthase (FAD)